MLPLVFELTTAAFSSGATIPARHTCTGENLSPALSWTVPPEGTASLALIVDDPDAPGRTWLHWTVWGLSPVVRGLPEGVQVDAPGMTQGTNDFRKVGYGGPCPPPGHGAHRYFFRLYALDTMVALPAGASRVELEGRMKGHILATTELMGKFWR